MRHPHTLRRLLMPAMPPPWARWWPRRRPRLGFYLLRPVERSRPGEIDVASLDRGFGPTMIQRYNRQFSIAIFGDVKPGAPLDQALKQIGGYARQLDLPPGYAFKFGGQSKLLDETTNNMVLALALASVFIYIVLAMQFESFVQPLVIMTVLPMSVPFALLTLWGTGRVLNLWSALGVLLLSAWRRSQQTPAD